MSQLNRLLSVAIFLASSIGASAFSTTHQHQARCRATGRSCRCPVVFAQPNEGTELVDDDNNATDSSPKSDTATNNKAALIFLHGLGDSTDGWASLAEALPNMRPSLGELDMTYVFPPAQMVAITVNGGEKMSGWFDVYDWPIGVDAKDDPKGLAMSVKRVEKIVTQLKEEEGIDPSRVVLGGFSQGAAVALMAAYNRRKQDAVPFAGCICMSGWLPMKEYLDVSEESAKTTPLFWAHGQFDDKILFEQQMYGVNKLEGVGVDVTACAYPVGHESSNFEEIDDMAGFLESVLCPQTETTKEPKSAQIDTEAAAAESASDSDDMNALLYYLCAMDLGDSGQVVGDSVPSSTAGVS
ncbi:hypothetical protein ACHAXT_006739 [Thalassiosira profunda]